MKRFVLLVLLMPLLSFAGQPNDSQPAAIKLHHAIVLKAGTAGAGFSYDGQPIYLEKEGDINNSCKIYLFSKNSLTIPAGQVIMGSLVRREDAHLLQHDRSVTFHSSSDIQAQVQVQVSCGTSGTFGADELSISDLNEVFKDDLSIKEL